MFSSGLYKQSLIVEVIDGTLRVGVRKTEGALPADNWTAFDHFELFYLGEKDPSSIEQIYTKSSSLSKGVYDLTGRKMRSTHSLFHRGVYIVDGKKVLIK